MIAHLHWADGQFYNASVFKGTNGHNGVWIPKNSTYCFSYGTNGHFMVIIVQIWDWIHLVNQMLYNKW